jgi:queuine tRNA-ribosyltransferase
MLLSEINIAYYQRLMRDIRTAISQRRFQDFREKTRADWSRGDIATR